MKVEQLYTGCIAEAAYYVESNGESAIIDPLREVAPYLELAKKAGTKIKYVFETHFHADFVSGHVTLAKETGAEIVYGPTANPSFDAIIAEDGQVFEIGNIKIKALHTPGHTMESTTYLLIDENGVESAIFTGDTLFLGDVGRPDLAQKAAHMTQEELAGMLFDSLRSKIMPLSDEITVYPGHGAGSACGKNMMKETIDTLGNQKKMNYALREDMTRDEFIKEVTDGLMPPPGYFPLNVKMNKEGYAHIDEVLSKGNTPLSPREFEVLAEQSDAIVLDVRNHTDYVMSHVPGSIFIGLNGGFAPWVGALLVDVKVPILLVVDEAKIDEAITRLSRVGFDNVLGYLKGGIQSWIEAGKEMDSIRSISAEEFEAEYLKTKYPIIDVRKPSEFQAEHVEVASNIPLDFINQQMSEFPKDKPFYVHCAGGYRSVIAASILKARGYHDLIDVAGGFGAISKTTIPTTNYVCPSTLK